MTMNSGILALFWWCLLGTPTTCSLAASPVRRRVQQDKEASTAATGNDHDDHAIYCRIRHLESLVLTLSPSSSSASFSEQPAPTRTVCHAADHTAYTVQWPRHTPRPSAGQWLRLPTAWIVHEENDKHANSAEPTIVIPEHRSLTEGEDLVVESQENAHNVPPNFARKGRKSLLVVRVVTATEEPDVLQDEIEASIFGTVPHPVLAQRSQEGLQTNTTAAQAMENGPYQSVVEQFAQASLRNLLYQPLYGPGYEFGVLQLRMAEYDPDFRIAGRGIQKAASVILKATAQRLGVASAEALTDVVDHIIFCLPNDSLLAGSVAWTAFTYLYEPFSYYQRSRCTKLSVVMHELGHSLGFRHSGVPTNAYADETGPMGYSINQYGAPRRGFNSHKNWISGWFQQLRVQLVPLSRENYPTTYVGRLVALADASRVQAGEDVALLRLGQTLYAQYNRAKGFHVQTGTPNTVTIVYAAHEEDESTRLASLKLNEVFIYGHDNATTSEGVESPDPNLGLVVALRSVGVNGEGHDAIDYAELVIQWRDPLAIKSTTDLNSTLCNIRNDPAKPFHRFGGMIDRDPNRGDKNPSRGDTLLNQSTDDRKETVLMSLGIIMAAIGVASLVISSHLVLRHCRQLRQAEQAVSTPPRSEIKSQFSMSSPESFDTARSNSTTSWADERSATPHEDDLAVHVTQVPHAPTPRKSEWWDNLLDNWKKFTSKGESSA